jgi:mono/diheme cytochrome c family protein
MLSQLNSRVSLLAGLLLMTLLVTACGGGATVEPTEPPSATEVPAGPTATSAGGARAEVEVPEAYQGRTNPLEGEEAIAAGQRVYDANCKTCHGEGGEGDGPAAQGLDPRPADLSDPELMAELTDAYLFWRISEGGNMEPFNSAMPAWGGALTEDQIWQAISYLRTLSQ